MNIYQLETVVQLTGTFTAADGVTPLDPTTVTLYVLKPGGTVTPYTGGSLTKVSTGVYSMNILIDRIGQWAYKFQGTGTVQATTPDTFFQVQPSVLMAT